jgi:5-methyltetrahydropteroyltriglutamate--homocysteine methyltransferase
MRRSTNRIIVSHAGVLPRPDDLREMMLAGDARADEFNKRLPSAVKEVVQRQAKIGIDTGNDGELSKRDGFSGYPRARLSGLVVREFEPGQGPKPHDVQGRDRREFPGFAAQGFPARFGGQPTGGGTAGPGGQGNRQVVMCVEPIKYIGGDLCDMDIRNLKAAAEGVDIEPYLPAVAPGTMEHWLYNDHYGTEEEFVLAIADAMREEYKKIVESGIMLQIDDPDLPDGWQMFPDMTVGDYRKYANLRVEALNHALAGLPADRIRFHTCWGSQHGPHRADIPLGDFVDIMLKINAECFSVEAANPQHDIDYHVWETTKLPDGKSYMPGVISHVSNHIEHPQLVAERLIRYANLMGRENVIAGTDCGMGSRVGHPEVCWAKFEAMVEGAKIATRELWGN